MRSAFVYTLLLGIKAASRLFYRVEMSWVGDVPRRPWEGLRLVAILNHTSLYEPLFAGGVPNHFLRQVAARGVVPAADVTLERPVVGSFFRLIAKHVIPVSRERDATWEAIVRKAGPRSMIVILPEGRMMRRGGLDKHGRPMTVRGGIADLLLALRRGRMLLGYSGGLHHVHAPGQLVPRLFKTIRMQLEVLEIARYREALLAAAGLEGFKRAVVRDLEERRARFCPCGLRSSAP